MNIEIDQNVVGPQVQGQGLDDRAIVEELFRRAYNEKPTDERWALISDYLQTEQGAGRSRRRAACSVR